MMTYLVLGGVFLGTLLLIVGAFAFVNRRRLADEAAIRSRLFGEAGPMVQAAHIEIFKTSQRASSLAFLNSLLEGKNFTAVVQAELDRAGSTQTVGTFVLSVGVAAAALGFIGVRFVSPVMGAMMGAVGAFAPIMALKVMQGKRYKKFEEQLPEGIDMLVNAMKAGYSLQAAMKFIGDELPQPLGPEFGRFYDEQRLGMDVRAALMNLQTRIDTLDVKMFVTALLIQRETGGNLAEIMTNLSTLMRERAAIRGQIDVLTAEPKMSAIVLTGLPIGLFIVVNVMNPDYMQPLYNTGTGRFMLAYGVASMLVGFVILKKMGNIQI